MTLMMAVITGFLFWLSFQEKKDTKGEVTRVFDGAVIKNANAGVKADTSHKNETKVSVLREENNVDPSFRKPRITGGAEAVKYFRLLKNLYVVVVEGVAAGSPLQNM